MLASVFVDECISPLFVDLLKKRGWDAMCSLEVLKAGASDIEQLAEAVKRKRVLVTTDKTTFLKHTAGMRHHGIIVIMRQVHPVYVSSIVTKVSKNLNEYTADEFNDLVLYVAP